MNFIRYFNVIFKLSPVVFLVNFITITCQALFEVLAIIALTPLIDFFIKKEDSSLSQITEKFGTVIRFFGAEPSLKTYIIVFLVLTILKSVLGLLFKYVSISIFFLKN